jgi:hypothetical protein
MASDSHGSRRRGLEVAGGEDDGLARHARIDLDVEIRAHRIRGRAIVDGSSLGFVGWMELVNVLERALMSPPPEAEGVS